MCDTVTRQILEDVIRGKVDRGEMFTAFEISLEAQQRGVTERHRHLKQAIHQYFEGGHMGGVYTRTLIHIPEAPQAAWLYHRTVDDPALFRPLDRSRMRPARSGAGQRAPRTAAGYGVDRRARVCVPVQLLRRAGLQPGDEAVVLVDRKTHSLALRKACPSSARSRKLTSYRVDRYGNVRIAQGVLQRARLGGHNYDIDGNDKRVVVHLHGAVRKN
jgi:hypothetical protein